MLPGGAPFKEFAEGLRRVAVADEDLATIPTRCSPMRPALTECCAVSCPTSQLLLVIDQFEELFTLTPEDEQRAFLDGLMYAVTATTAACVSSRRSAPTSTTGRCNSIASAPRYATRP